jgi:hypothetical protein
VFGIPLPFETLTPGSAGVRLMLEDAAGAMPLGVHLPGGALWTRRRGGWVYRDPAGATAGIRTLVLSGRSGGALSDVRLKVAGRDGGYPVLLGDLPPTLTIVLGDAAAAHAGACGRYTFGGSACTTASSGARLVCR